MIWLEAFAISNKTLLEKSATLLGTGALLVASYPPREKVLVDSFASNYKCLTSSNKKLLIRILIIFLLLLVVRHLFLIASLLLRTSKAPVTTSVALVGWKPLLLGWLSHNAKCRASVSSVRG